MYSVGMFRAPTVQLILHVWLNFVGRFFVVDSLGGVTRSDSESEELKGYLCFSHCLFRPALVAFNYLHAHLTCSDSESEDSKGCFFLFALPLPAFVAYFFMLILT